MDAPLAARVRRVCLGAFAALGLLAGAAHAEVRLVTLSTDQNEPIRAVLGEPAPRAGKRPAVIFNHGTDVRRDGYEGAQRGSMNVDDYVNALSERSYVALAPLRTLLAREATLDRGRLVGTPQEWDAVLAYGLRAIAAARAYLEKRADVDASAIVLMGYSEGGNLSLWSAIRSPGYRAVVLLAPAAMPTSTQYRLRDASQPEQLRRIGAPVFLAVAQDDFAGIRQVVSNELIPNLQQLGVRLRARTDYPGGHNRFFRVEPDLWNDVTGFLRENGL